MSRLRRRNGLTLTEVLIAIGIVIVAFLLFVPATRRVREASAQLACSNNLKNLILGILNYQMIGTPAEPADRMLPSGCLGAGTIPEDRLSWMVAVLPYVDNEHLFKKFDTTKSFQANLPAAQTRVPVFQCGRSAPTPELDQLTHYVAMAGIGLDAAERPAGAAGNGLMGYDRRTTWSMIKDGTSATIALMETRSNLGPWARGGASNLRGFDPSDLPIHGDQRPFGGHKVGINVAMADGSVHCLHPDIDPNHLATWITIAGRESVPFDPD